MTKSPESEWDGWTDEALDLRWNTLCERHDRLIDSAPMGDERIYFAGKEMDSIRAEQKRRAGAGRPVVSFVTETDVKAVRKRHRCDGCGAHIEIGEPAKRWAGMTDGEFGTAIYHPDCRAAEVRLNDLAGWGFGDDWYPLSDAGREDWPWLIEEFPAVAARMNIPNRVEA